MPSINDKPKYVTGRRNKIWIRTVDNLEFRDPNVLWNELWPRYNTLSISLLDENAFFADALCIAKHARNRQELEHLLAEKMKERREELSDALNEIGLAVIYHRHMLGSEAARIAASKVVRTTSLDSFLQFVGGFTFGWAGELAIKRREIEDTPGECGDAAQDVPHDGEEHDDDSFIDYGFTQWDSDIGSLNWSLSPCEPITPPTTNSP